MREGYAEARSRLTHTRSPDRYVRKWLQLRLGAQVRGRVMTDDVTPSLLQAIDVEECPVLRVALTHGERGDADWSVDRLNNDGAYAANNLAVMSTRANRAKGALDFAEVQRRAVLVARCDGLEPVEWARLAALMLGPCFAQRPCEAPLIPLNVPIPRHSARPAVQQIQHVFAQSASRPAGKNRLVKAFKTVCGDERSRVRLSFLADAVHGGLKSVHRTCDVWLQPAAMPALAAWRASLGEQGWAAAGEVSRALTGARTIPSRRIASWHLDTRGYVA